MLAYNIYDLALANWRMMLKMQSIVLDANVRLVEMNAEMIREMLQRLHSLEVSIFVGLHHEDAHLETREWAATLPDMTDEDLFERIFEAVERWRLGGMKYEEIDAFPAVSKNGVLTPYQVETLVSEMERRINQWEDRRKIRIEINIAELPENLLFPGFMKRRNSGEVVVSAIGDNTDNQSWKEKK